MAGPPGQDAAARLLERLLTDPAFRERFSRDPSKALEAAGLPLDTDPALEPLERRESRAALAGAALAAMSEAVSLGAITEHVLPHLQALRQHLPGGQLTAGVPEFDAGDEEDGDGGDGGGGDDADDSDDGDDTDDGDDGDDPDDSDDGDDSSDDGDDSSSGDADDDDDDSSGGDDSSSSDVDDQDEDGDSGDGDGGDDSDDGNDSSDGGDDSDDSNDSSDGGDSSDDSSDSSGDGDGDSSDGDDSDAAGGDAGDRDDGSGGGGVDLDVVPGGAEVPYPGDSAARAKIAAWMGRMAERRGLPRELPVMAALVESGMRNVAFGDADSVGYFQMRTGIWNAGAYVGYAKRPELQLRWFLDQAEAVKRQRVAAGLPIDDPRHYGDWIADIERPAAQFRGRYALRLSEAQDLLGRAADVPAAGRRAAAALAAARHQLGTPYKWGGASPSTGFDCSGLVQWAYARVGITLPRVSEEQYLVGKHVSRDRLLPGDLVFFRNASGDVHHVGISLGGDRFLNAPHTGDVVKEASLKEPYYAQQFAGGRRLDVPGGG